MLTIIGAALAATLAALFLFSQQPILAIGIVAVSFTLILTKLVSGLRTYMFRQTRTTDDYDVVFRGAFRFAVGVVFSAVALANLFWLLSLPVFLMTPFAGYALISLAIIFVTIPLRRACINAFSRPRLARLASIATTAAYTGIWVALFQSVQHGPVRVVTDLQLALIVSLAALFWPWVAAMQVNGLWNQIARGLRAARVR